jgi:TPR repeat protein
MCLCAQMLYFGKGVEKNLSQPLFMLNQLLIKDIWAQYALGNCYRDGIGTERDLLKAKEWYKRSAEQGYILALYELER